MSIAFGWLVAPFESLAFMRAALIACIMLAVANGAIGTLLLLRRMSLDADVLGHAVMPGAAIGFLYAGPSAIWLSVGGLLSGLAVAALAGATGAGEPSGRQGGGRQGGGGQGGGRNETSLVAFYLAALSAGVLLVIWRGSNVDIVRVLFGTVLAIDRPALLQIAAVSSIVMLAIAALYRPLAVNSFDPAFLRGMGARTPYGAIVTVLALLSLVASFQAFGTLLALGPLLLPAAAALCWRLGVCGSMVLAALFGVAASIAGLLLSYHGNLPSGPLIVLAGAVLYAMSYGIAHALRALRGRLRPSLLAVAGALALISPAQATEPLRVAATFSVIGDMLTRVGGGDIDLKVLVGPGGDSELYQPTTADAATVAAARAVFFNGLNDEFEPWLGPLLKQAGFQGSKIVVSRGVRTLTAEEEHPVSARQMPASIDHHAWLDPRNGVIYVRNIAAALARLDPANAAAYRSRAAAYEQEIQAADSWARQQLASVPPQRRRVLASHDSLQYLASAYGITLLSVNGWTNQSEPTGTELAKLVRQIRAEHVKVVFLDSITDPRVMQRVASETGAVIGGTLYGDSLSPPDGEAGSYVAMLRHDVAVLKAGMEQK